MSELKPCPFCGGEPEFRENTHWAGQRSVIVSVEVRHFCPKVEGQPHTMSVKQIGRDKESAIKAWNTRTDDKTIALLKEARDAFKTISCYHALTSTSDLAREQMKAIDEHLKEPLPKPPKGDE